MTYHADMGADYEFDAEPELVDTGAELCMVGIGGRLEPIADVDPSRATPPAEPPKHPPLRLRELIAALRAEAAR